MSRNKEAVVAESWQRTLTGIPTLLGRLAYLATLRNANTGTYEHFGLAQKIGQTPADRLLHSSHLDVFQQWLGFGLERQKRELEDYFSELEGSRQEILATWLSLEPYSTWIPAESRDVERRLFYSDLETVLDLIRVECGVASRDPDS